MAQSGKREERINAEFAENTEDAEKRREKRTARNGCATGGASGNVKAPDHEEGQE